MNKLRLPVIRMDARPSGLKFKAPASAVAKWNRTIKAAAKQPDTCAIDVLGEIGDSGWGAECTTAVMVKAQLKAAGNAPVLLTINSPGGDAFEGIAIYNLLREHPGAVNVNVIGMAASAASIIAMAGEKITMSPAAMLMIHSAWGMVVGNRNDMREMADMLDKIDTAVAGLYASRSGMKVPDVMALMEAETWMTGPEAVANGFADVAIAEKKPKASNRSSIFARVPVVLLGASAGTARPAVQMSVKPPGAAGTFSKDIAMKTIAEQIAAFEAKRQASAARMTDIMSKAADEGRTLDETETQEYDTIAGEVKALDAHLVRLKAHETTMLATVKPVTAVVGADPEAASKARALPHSGIVSVGNRLVPGQGFARQAMALYLAKGSPRDAVEIVKANRNWMDTTPELAKVFMTTAVPAGDTTTAGWASELVYANNLAAEFIEYLRPMTIIGRLNGLRKVPFNIRVPSQTASGTGYWVGQGKPIGVSKITTSSKSLGIAKAAGLMAVDDELMRSSSPSAEVLVRDDLAKTIQTMLDVSFIDPNQGGVANVQPASILYGITPVTPSGVNAAAVSTDVALLFSTAIAANQGMENAVFVMTPTAALALSLMLTSLGAPQYPTININGGTWLGLPVLVSQSAYIAGSPQFGQMIVLVFPSEIMLADDGQVTIELSTEASIEMLDVPTNLSTGGTTATTMVSMFQTQSVAIKAVRYINWVLRRSTAAAFIQAANYH